MSRGASPPATSRRGRPARRGAAAALLAAVAVALAASAGAAPASAGSALTASALAPSKSAPSRSGPSALTPAQVRAQEWWIVSLNLHRAWSISKGLGVTVALLDSGVDAGFGDLRGAVRPGFIPGGRGDARSDTDPEIHGTRLADEIAGRGTGFGLLGIAPRASVLPVVIPDHDFARPTAAALNRLATLEHPPDVVNMSYGSPRACPGDVQAAVLHAVRAGIIVVAAAGNSGASTNAAAYPADCAGVVAVGAVDVHGRAWSDTERQPYVALAAPGVHMISADPQAASGYGYADGTSDAAAIVSGIFALVRARFPRLSARGVVTRVLATAHQFAGRQGSRNDRVGFGVALPYNALTAKVPASAPNPVYDAVTAGKNPVAHTAAPSGASAAGSATPPGPPRTAAAGADPSGGSTGVLVGGLVAAVVIVGLVLTLLLRRRPRS